MDYIIRAIRESVEALKPKVFNVQEADSLVGNLKREIKAPHVNAYKSTLGGDEHVSVMVTISLDKKSAWENNILENSNYGKFHVGNDGSIEMISGNMRPWMRKTRFKAVKDVPAKFNKYLEKVERN